MFVLISSLDREDRWRLRRCSVVIIDLYGMFRVWTDTRNTAARNAVMFGLIEFTPLRQSCAGGLQHSASIIFLFNTFREHILRASVGQSEIRFSKVYLIN